MGSGVVPSVPLDDDLLVLKRDCGIAVVTGGLSSSSTM